MHGCCKDSGAKEQNRTSTLNTTLLETQVCEGNETLKEVTEGEKNKMVIGVTKAKEMCLKKSQNLQKNLR